MFDSIQLALSGMVGYQRGLDVISNNVSNINTPGFRGSNVEFVDLFGGKPTDGSGDQPVGAGVDSSRTVLSDAPGTTQQTGRDLDLALSGPGFFVLQNPAGVTSYTRNGSFEFDTDHNLILSSQNVGATTLQPEKVMALNANGQLSPINIQALLQNAAKPTTTVSFKDNLSPSDPDFTISSVTIVDPNGGSHAVQMIFSKDTTTPTAGAEVNWNVSLTENNVPVGAGELQFLNSEPEPGSTLVPLTLTFTKAPPMSVSFDFSGVQGNSTGATTDGTTRNSTMSVSQVDGFVAGVLTTEKFDEKGVLQLAYSNGQTVQGPTLALADIQDQAGLIQEENSIFKYEGTAPVRLRVAGDDLTVKGQTLEASNVDLTTEFSKIILMQRGYQAASEVVSTANSLLQQLIDMRGGK